MVEPASHLVRQYMHYALTDTEKTYSGLTDGCAKVGRAGCKLIEFTGDNVTGDDMKTFMNYVHDVSNFLSGLGDQSDIFSALVGP